MSKKRHVVFLRGAVPPAHEHPEKLDYEGIEQCPDMWTQLFYYTAQKLGATGELLYDATNHSAPTQMIQSGDSFLDRREPFSRVQLSQPPDLIVCRGGFPYYDAFLRQFPNAKKAYYGAGKRFHPVTDFWDYDLFLVDSPKHYQWYRDNGYTNVAFILKTAATLFRPMNVEKAYDIGFFTLTTAALKRYDLFFEAFSKTSYTALHHGYPMPDIARKAKKYGVNITWGGYLRRPQLVKEMNRCRVGVICSDHRDSCPRTILEYFACNIPVVVTRDMSLWLETYITPQTGVAVKPKPKALRQAIKEILDGKREVSPRQYFEKRLSMKQVSGHLASLLGELLS